MLLLEQILLMVSRIWQRQVLRLGAPIFFFLLIAPYCSAQSGGGGESPLSFFGSNTEAVVLNSKERNDYLVCRESGVKPRFSYNPSKNFHVGLKVEYPPGLLRTLISVGSEGEGVSESGYVGDQTLLIILNNRFADGRRIHTVSGLLSLPPENNFISIFTRSITDGQAIVSRSNINLPVIGGVIPTSIKVITDDKETVFKSKESLDNFWRDYLASLQERFQRESKNSVEYRSKAEACRILAEKERIAATTDQFTPELRVQFRKPSDIHTAYGSFLDSSNPGGEVIFRETIRQLSDKEIQTLFTQEQYSLGSSTTYVLALPVHIETSIGTSGAVQSDSIWIRTEIFTGYWSGCCLPSRGGLGGY